MTHSIISATNITLTRDAKPLLSDISLSLKAGETTIIMGPNGAGKTLLLSALHGLAPIQSGTVTKAANSQQKMVFQKPILLRRTARSHFTFASGIKDEAAIISWFERAGIADKMTTSARHLSSGEAQKLALISALATKPDILFLDEPTANLDTESRGGIEALISGARQSGTAILMVTHALAQASRLADHFIYLQGGKIYDHSTAERFLSGKRSAEASAFLAEL